MEEPMCEKENSSSHGSNEGCGPKPYGYILALNENGQGIKRIFGICKNVINMGRGSRNDIRLNARMFSRLHVTMTISQEDDGSLKVNCFDK